MPQAIRTVTHHCSKSIQDLPAGAVPGLSRMAKMLLDTALATSGLLERKLGDTSVNADQSCWGVGKREASGSDEQKPIPTMGALYRRSLYTFCETNCNDARYGCHLCAGCMMPRMQLAANAPKLTLQPGFDDDPQWLKLTRLTGGAE